MRGVRIKPSLEEVDRRLRRIYRRSRLGNPRDPLSDLIFILLSAQTEEYNYQRTYRALRRRFRSWSGVRAAGVEQVYETILIGGLGRKKARQIIDLLTDLARRRGAPSLAYLRRLPDDDAMRELESLPGVGHKTASCVMLYALDRPVFPVDTHVWRVLGRLGVAPRKPINASLARSLEAIVPRRLRYRLHVNLVLHGRATCTATRPRCASCPLDDLCPKIGVVEIRQEADILALRSSSRGATVRQNNGRRARDLPRLEVR